MYCRIVRNDIAKSKVISISTMIFVAASAMLISLAAILVVNLSGAIDTLMLRSKTPHFMQMHAGEIDMVRLTAFAKQNSNVDNFQVVEFLNVDGARIIFDKSSLADSVQDNGFCMQNENFDYLLDLNGNVIKASDGELYVPICYGKDHRVKIGDKALICGQEFTVAGFLRDSQMNSTLASSKRFLVSNHDYVKIKNSGSIEYLIEFRLKDESALGKFEAAYTKKGLEANGPTITYPLFKTINAISDGFMIAVILLISVLVVAIALLCIRLTLLAKIEEDYQEIGVMKAIGLRVSDIKKIYLAKYAAVAAAGCILGFLISLIVKDILLSNIRLYMGESENAYLALLLGILGTLLVFVTIVLYVNGVLKCFRKISEAELLRLGIVQEKTIGAKWIRLSKNQLFDTNTFLGMKDVFVRKKIYMTMLIVLVLSAFIMIVPQNVYHTISQKSFITNMGIGNCDMRIDIQQVNDISGKAEKIAERMDSDSAISKYVVLTTKTYTVIDYGGLENSIKIELGDHSVFPVKYSQGIAPTAEGEIALSVMNADELSKKVGDRITIMVNGNKKNLMVCGLYSDITNGGKTAKAIFTDHSDDIMWCVINAELSDQALITNKTIEYEKQFDFAKVSGVDEYVSQVFGSTINSMKKASHAAMIVAIFITGLVTLLFMKMLILKDRYSIALLKAFGFTDQDIIIQYIVRAVFVLVVGIIFGTFLSNTIGEMIAAAAIASFGAASFQFTINLFFSYLFCPLLMIVVVLGATVLGTLGVRKIKISENCKA